MKKLARWFRCGELGFTLIELLVVISILAALAGVVTIAVTRFIGRGEAQACATDLHNVTTVTSAYRWEEGRCPENVDDLRDGGYLMEEPLGEYEFDENDNGECVVKQTACPR